MSKFDEWYDTMLTLQSELERCLEGANREGSPNLYAATDMERDEEAIYAGVVVTLADERRVRISIEPADE